jgi:hypothetical protein
MRRSNCPAHRPASKEVRGGCRRTHQANRGYCKLCSCYLSKNNYWPWLGPTGTAASSLACLLSGAVRSAGDNRSLLCRWTPRKPLLPYPTNVRMRSSLVAKRSLFTVPHRPFCCSVRIVVQRLNANSSRPFIARFHRVAAHSIPQIITRHYIVNNQSSNMAPQLDGYFKQYALYPSWPSCDYRPLYKSRLN